MFPRPPLHPIHHPNIIPPIGAIGTPTLGPFHIPPITFTNNTPQSIKLILDEFAGIKKEPDKCTCDIMKLMSVGCRCGQFQREQSRQ